MESTDTSFQIQPSASSQKFKTFKRKIQNIKIKSTARVTNRGRNRSTSSSPGTSSPSSSTSTLSESTTLLTTPSQTSRQTSCSRKTPTKMSKLSESLKALISAPHARPSYTRAPATLKSLLADLHNDARSKNIGLPAWLTISTATSMTLNCPEAMAQLFSIARDSDPSKAVLSAELMREVGLKCISFNGIPRSINCLGAFYSSLPSDVRDKLSKTPTRAYTRDNIEQRIQDGYGLWDSVYFGFERKLLDKLAQSHPDLPVHIISSHYSNLLSDPSTTRIPGAKVGRVLTSLVAIACLRAQSGVGPQVTSHVFGLRKAYERGDAGAEGEESVDGGEWLAGEEGNRWILETVDRIVGAVAGSEGTTFAPGLRSKL